MFAHKHRASGNRKTLSGLAAGLQLEIQLILASKVSQQVR
jgi:hypothetical protein